MTMQLRDVGNRRYYYYAEVNAAQSTEGAMKILFLATAACLVLSLSSSAQGQTSSAQGQTSSAQGEKDKFSDQYCVPFCINRCANKFWGDASQKERCKSQVYNSRCLPMCRELGH